MSYLDIHALEANFEGWHNERALQMTQSEAFERYAVENILKDSDLTDEEIQSGNFGGEDDGGVDAMYFFVNQTLIRDETELPDPAITAQLYIIQAKFEKGFTEGAIEKLNQFTRDLLDFTRPVTDLTYLNSLARDAIARFREKYEQILGSQHTLDVTFHYATKSDTDPNNKVLTRVEELKRYVSNQLSAANVKFEFCDCRTLLAAARSWPAKQLTLEMTKSITTDDGAAIVCLVQLKSFASFLTDEHGGLRRSILEPNVRDYQGKGNAVNREIRETLGSSDDREFWWLNNGVTLLATKYSTTGNKLTVEQPQIVNGLQTSQEIFSYFKDRPEKTVSRNLLIRVIIPPDEQTRTKITKATNFQTPVAEVSLHATDPIHFDIEDRLKLYGLFYDRRKGEYKNLRKPISQIISIRHLARAVIAIVLRRPNDARARPQTLLNKPDTYTQIFNEEYNRELYVACILLDRQVEKYLDSLGKINRDARRDIRYYVGMCVACGLVKNSIPTPQEIAGILPSVVSSIPEDQLGTTCQEVLSQYQDLGGDDKVAKGTELNAKLASHLNKLFSPGI